MTKSNANHPVKAACLQALVKHLQQIVTVDVLADAREAGGEINTADGAACINAAKRQVISVLQNQIDQSKAGGGNLRPIRRGQR